MNKPVKAPIQDLREWLDRVDQLGELVRIDQPERNPAGRP